MSTEPEVREPIRAVLAVLDSAAGTAALVADSLAEWVHDACEPVEDLPVVAPAVRTLDATAGRVLRGAADAVAIACGGADWAARRACELAVGDIDAVRASISQVSSELTALAGALREGRTAAPDRDALGGDR